MTLFAVTGLKRSVPSLVLLIEIVLRLLLVKSGLLLLASFVASVFERTDSFLSERFGSFAAVDLSGLSAFRVLSWSPLPISGLLSFVRLVSRDGFSMVLSLVITVSVLESFLRCPDLRTLSEG